MLVEIKGLLSLGFLALENHYENQCENGNALDPTPEGLGLHGSTK